jgi:hypothetical protein
MSDPDYVCEDCSFTVSIEQVADEHRERTGHSMVDGDHEDSTDEQSDSDDDSGIHWPYARMA